MNQQFIDDNFCDEPCMSLYEDSEFRIVYNEADWNQHESFLSAPLYQQVIAWLRTKGIRIIEELPKQEGHILYFIPGTYERSFIAHLDLPEAIKHAISILKQQKTL
jgi:hypothetical protein